MDAARLPWCMQLRSGRSPVPLLSFAELRTKFDSLQAAFEVEGAEAQVTQSVYDELAALDAEIEAAEEAGEADKVSRAAVCGAGVFCWGGTCLPLALTLTP